MASLIGVYYKNRQITHVKVPDCDWELDDHRHIMPGETLVKVPNDLFGIPTHNTLHAFVCKVEELLGWRLPK